MPVTATLSPVVKSASPWRCRGIQMEYRQRPCRL